MAKKPKRLYADVKVDSLEEFKEMIMGITAKILGGEPENLLTDEEWEEKYSKYKNNAMKGKNTSL